MKNNILKRRKLPKESALYPKMSNGACGAIREIIKEAIDSGNNKIFIRTNLKRGLPLENINKVAGPFVEAWALEKFEEISDKVGNKYGLVNVEVGKRLDPFDMILQFKLKGIDDYVSANVDSKATAEDILTSGKSPNITSFARIRNEYLNDPDYIFLVLSLKHKVFSEKIDDDGITNGIMQITAYHVYDIKYVSAKDLNYNPALGTGQMQIKDIHYVDEERKTVEQFIKMIDNKYIKSKGLKPWIKLAEKFNWLKSSE
ncbi:restriction endonuclease [Candidatus Shapirobacteria bacterium]|nr:restriction endonuclease [Candidatus Shapirobacteria bacterium]